MSYIYKKADGVIYAKSRFSIGLEGEEKVTDNIFDIISPPCVLNSGKIIAVSPLIANGIESDITTNPHIPTELELAQQDITGLQLNDIEQGQQMTDLELTILGGGTNV